MGEATPQSPSYYGRPVLRPPVWKPTVSWYFFAGGLAGASGVLAAVARLAGNRPLARTALAGALAGSAVSPVLLIDDLGRPERFLNMLRLFKVTSPMSVGSWVLAAFGGATATAAASEFGGLMRPLGRLAELAAALLGPVLATYTAVLVADTAVPAWQEAGTDLPLLFAAGSAASAGALASVLTAPDWAGPARKLAVGGAIAELAAAARMESRLGSRAAAYRGRSSGPARSAAAALLLAGAGTLVLAGRRRPGAVAGGALVLAGAFAERVAVFRAGFDQG